MDDASNVTTLQRRIMRRVTYALMIGFFAFVGILIIFLQLRGRVQLADRNEFVVESIADTVDQEFFRLPIEIMQDVASSTAMRNYARLLLMKTPEEFDANDRLIQETFLSNADNVLSSHGEHYLSIRYVNRAGQEIGEVHRVDGVTRVSSDARGIDPANPTFRLAFSLGRVGEPVIGPIVPAEEGDGETVTIAVPVSVSGNVSSMIGMLMLTLSTDPLVERVSNIVDDPVVELSGREVLLVDAENNVIAASGAEINQGVLDFLAEGGTNQSFSISNLNTGITSTKVIDLLGVTTPWRVVVADDFLAASLETNVLSLIAIIICLGTLLLLISVINELIRPLVRPLYDANTMVGQLAEGGLLDENQIADVNARLQGQDDIHVLMRSTIIVSDRLKNLQESLQSTIARHNRDMQVTTRLGRETATLHDMGDILNRTINLICDGFGYYHAQVFLIDDAGVNANLAYSRGVAGQKMLEQGHKLAVDSESVVGRAIRSRETVIVDDTTQQSDGQHRFNPLLPETQSEMGVPLSVGGQVIGVLDIQSRSAASFDSEDVQTLELVADQLAIAIQNARLNSETEQRLQQIDALNRQLTRSAWEEADQRLNLNREYSYNLAEVSEGIPEEDARAALKMPINVRGEVIGELQAEPTEGQEFTEGDHVILQSVAERVALAIENARLFQETQLTLSETSALYQLSRYLNEANTLEDIIQAIVVSVMPSAIGGQVWMFDDYAYGEQPTWIELHTDLVIGEERADTAQNLAGTRLQMKDHPFFQELGATQIGLIPDVNQDSRLDGGLRLIFRRMAAQAAVAIPLTVRNVWRGLIMVEFGEPQTFDEREARIFVALIDQAGVAIDNRLLLQQTEEEVARNENLYAASRIINTAQNMQDLVYAAVATSPDPDLRFSLSLLEGKLDEWGWPTRARIVAESDGDEVHEVNSLHVIEIPEDSPIREREAEIFVDDLPSNPNVSESVKWMRSLGYRFMAVFPLFSANQPIAVFRVFAQQPRELTARDYEVYRALTGQMASQIQIRRLLDQTESALDETRRLYVASSAIAAAQDAERVYESSVEHLARPFLLTQSDGQIDQDITISLMLATPDATADTQALEYAFVWSSQPDGSLEPGMQVSSQDYPYGRLTDDAAGPVYFQDVPIDDPESQLNDEPELKKLLLAQGVGSMVALPIRSRQNWFGVVLCQSDREYAFSEQYVRFASAISGQIATAIDRQRLFDEARDAAERAQAEAQRALALAEVAQLASRIGDDFEASLRDIFERVVEEAGFDRWMVLLMNDDRTSLESLIVRAPGTDDDTQISYSLETDSLDTGMPVVDAVRMNQSFIVNDPATYPSFVDFHEVERDEVANFFGKHIAVPIRLSGSPTGALFVGRGLDQDDLADRDDQLIATLAAQVSVALENRALFDRVQGERQTLQSILETLPAGVLVLDANTLKPMVSNQQVEALLGRDIDLDSPFSIEFYNLYRTGTELLYPEDEMPIFTALREGQLRSSDDVAVITEDTQIDLLIDAAPILNSRGQATSIVAAFSDISNLRSLENTLQENLRETVQLYEAQRQLSEAGNLEEVLDVLIMQFALIQPLDAFILSPDNLNDVSLARQLIQPLEHPQLLEDYLDDQDLIRMDNIQDVSDDLQTMLLDMGAQSFITLPMRSLTRNQLLGWIVLVSENVAGLPESLEPLLTQLSDMASTALDNHYLIESQQSTVREVQALYSANTSISRVRDIDQLSQVLSDASNTLDPAYFGAYLDESSGLQEEWHDLVSLKADDELSDVDFRAIMLSAELPPDGLYIDDLTKLHHPDDMEQQLIAAGIRGLAAIHLRPRDTNSGFLVAAYTQPHQFSETENRYVNTMSDGASIILNNLILFDQIQQALEETSILYQASRALSDATTPAEIIDVVVNFLIAPHINQVFIALLTSRDWDSPGATVQIVSSWNEEEGVELEGVALSADQFPAWKQLSSMVVTTIDDIYEDDELDDMQRIGIESLDARSLTIIPLRVPSREIGAVWIGSRDPHTHSDREVRNYQAFAEQASLSLEASYLLQQTERRARQLETSAEVSQSATTILDLEVLMPRLVDLVRDAFNYDHVQIFLMDERDEYAELRASTGEAGRQLLEIRHKLAKSSDSVIGAVTASGEPTIALDTADANVVHQPNPYLPLTRSEMALPLIIKGQVVGALDVQSNQPNAFNEEDIRAVTTLAGQIAVAIDNANLYASAQAQADNMGFLFEVTNAAASADELDVALQQVADFIYERLDPLSVTVYLPQLYMDEMDHSYMTMKPVALAGVDQPLTEVEEIRIDDAENIVSLIASNLQPFIVDDVRSEERYLPVISGAQTAALLPLSSGSEMIGLIALEDTRRDAFNYDVIQILLTLTGSLSAVVQSTLLLQQLTQTNEQLRELDRLKSDFLANMSHELRTPLNSIIGFSRVMLKGIDGPLTEMQEQDLTTIYNSGQHLLYLINDILDQAKIAAGKLDIKFAYFEIKPLVEAVKSIGVGLVKDKTINMLMESAPNLPKVYGDEFRTRQVLLNLVSNAAKFTSEGSVTIRTYPWHDELHGRDMIRIDVVDTGIGIDEKDQPLLFEAFRQVDSSLTRTQGGTGLGLPIAKSLVEMQGGEMFVESEVNAGSVFSITIPIEPVMEEDEPEPVEPEMEEELDPATQIEPNTNVGNPMNPSTKPMIDLRNITSGPPPKVMQTKREVLLIEDDKNMVDQFRRVLQREGFEVHTADHQAYAEAMASNLRPTIVVMDVNFAEGEGWNILARLKDRDDTFDIPIIIVTLSDESERAYQTGAHTFIQRPFVPEDLVEAALEAEKESNTERILIIDDQPEAIRLLTEVLNENGTYRVFSAESGVEGISLVARRRPDLIILDLRMPEMDGFAVLEELRSNPETATIPVMVVTGEINLKEEEQEQLTNVHVLQKTDISQEEYEEFIEEVKQHLDFHEGN